MLKNLALCAAYEMCFQRARAVAPYLTRKNDGIDVIVIVDWMLSTRSVLERL